MATRVGVDDDGGGNPTPAYGVRVEHARHVALSGARGHDRRHLDRCRGDRLAVAPGAYRRPGATGTVEP